MICKRRHIENVHEFTRDAQWKPIRYLLYHFYRIGLDTWRARSHKNLCMGTFYKGIYPGQIIRLYHQQIISQRSGLLQRVYRTIEH